MSASDALDACEIAITRTLWTNEFSPFLSDRLGVSVRNPFWSPRMHGFACKLAGSLKVSNDDVKPFFRDFSHKYLKVPHNTAYRKKIGVHEGSGVNQIIADLVQSPAADSYSLKNIYCYQAFQLIYEERADYNEVLSTLVV